MTLADLKALAERFRQLADNLNALDALADATVAAHPHDARAVALCDRFRAAADGDAVRTIADDVAARAH